MGYIIRQGRTELGDRVSGQPVSLSGSGRELHQSFIVENVDKKEWEYEEAKKKYEQQLSEARASGSEITFTSPEGKVLGYESPSQQKSIMASQVPSSPPYFKPAEAMIPRQKTGLETFRERLFESPVKTKESLVDMGKTAFEKISAGYQTAEKKTSQALFSEGKFNPFGINERLPASLTGKKSNISVEYKDVTGMGTGIRKQISEKPIETASFAVGTSFFQTAIGGSRYLFTPPKFLSNIGRGLELGMTGLYATSTSYNILSSKDRGQAIGSEFVKFSAVTGGGILGSKIVSTFPSSSKTYTYNTNIREKVLFERPLAKVEGVESGLLSKEKISLTTSGVKQQTSTRLKFGETAKVLSSKKYKSPFVSITKGNIQGQKYTSVSIARLTPKGFAGKTYTQFSSYKTELSFVGQKGLLKYKTMSGEIFKVEKGILPKYAGVKSPSELSLFSAKAKVYEPLEVYGNKKGYLQVQALGQKKYTANIKKVFGVQKVETSFRARQTSRAIIEKYASPKVVSRTTKGFDLTGKLESVYLKVKQITPKFIFSPVKYKPDITLGNIAYSKAGKMYSGISAKESRWITTSTQYDVQKIVTTQKSGFRRMEIDFPAMNTKGSIYSNKRVRFILEQPSQISASYPKIKAVSSPAVFEPVVVPVSSSIIIPRGITRPRTEIVTQPKTRIVTQPRTEIVPRIKTEIKTQIKTELRTQLRTQLQTNINTNVPSGIGFRISQPPPPPPPNITPSLLIPKPKKAVKKSKQKFIPSEFNPKYFASIEAVSFGIKGVKPPKIELMKGLNIRPIVR